MRGARGVTLVELMVVVAVVGLLSAMLIARFAEARRDAADARALHLLSQLRSAVIAYEAKTGHFPRHMHNAAGPDWDNWVADVQTQMGDLRLPHSSRMCAIVNCGVIHNGGVFQAGNWGFPYGMGMAAATVDNRFYIATPYEILRCPHRAWHAADCVPIQ